MADSVDCGRCLNIGVKNYDHLDQFTTQYIIPFFSSTFYTLSRKFLLEN